MVYSVLLALAVTGAAASSASYSSRVPESTIEPSVTAISAAAASATALSPVSDVPGLAFDRVIQIWLENQDYAKGAADPNLKWIAERGLTLSQYYGITHPSEPNYCAAAGGDNFGMDNDDFNTIPANVSTVVDLLDTKGISWGEYQEHIPYAGFEGFNYSNQQTYANDYVRKHNPLAIYESVSQNATRLSLIKGFDNFYSDLANHTLPQWAFITPNMTNDGHDTTITYTGNWARTFIEPLLNNTYFMNNTLIILTFDEVETYTVHNNPFTILLGGAVPADKINTTDSTFYTHYSMISTVSVNWGLPSLGRWDCGANVIDFVASAANYTNADVDTSNLFFNSSYPGPVSDALFYPVWDTPNTVAKCASGMGVLDTVVSTWGKSNGTKNYTNAYPYDQLVGNDVGGTPTQGLASGATYSTTASATATSTKKSGASTTVGSISAVLAAAVLVALAM
ncbi:hypothetical protein BP5796_13103 [Coleophoma crateriformis]|uniref:acid phosphatase n=1 Tax=Coleophoma crateriformis TaxID=565419 RepID=A0A3D8Q4T4_9HELO|nr:hypothetical protein BP5796_13103 [Coleophoma crateriformis]